MALTMMLAGIGLIGFVTGSLASWIVERIASGEKSGESADDIATLLRELRELHREVAELRAEAGIRPVTGSGAERGSPD